MFSVLKHPRNKIFKHINHVEFNSEYTVTYSAMHTDKQPHLL